MLGPLPLGERAGVWGRAPEGFAALAVARPDRRGRRQAGRRQERAAALQGRSARGPRQRAALIS